MRLIHFADNHLGAGSDRRQQDILDSFAEAVDKIIALKPDLVINAGDLFHMVHPSNRVIAFVSEQLLKLGREAGIPTVVISGNHDAPKQRHIGAVLSIFKDFENIYPIYKSRFEQVTIGRCTIAAVPHCLTSEILKDELQKIAPDPAADYNILVLHGVVGGIKEFQMADLSEQEIASSYFNLGFDYVALGHYHNFTEIQPMVYYSGSTERLSQSEAAHDKGFIEVDFDAPESKVTFHKIASRAMIDLPEVKVRGRSAEEIMAELERKVREQNPEDKIIRIKLTDIPDATYRSLPFDRIADLKNEAFSLDVRFEKEEKPEENLYADLNLGRLDQAFEKFLGAKVVEGLDKEKLKSLGLDFLHRAEDQDIP
jgi:exonuclease SbcD